MQDINLNFNLKELNLDSVRIDVQRSENVEHEKIAIIGVDAKVGGASSIDEIWQVFLHGKNMVSDLSPVREADARNLLSDLGKNSAVFSEKAYLPRIDLFDPEYFNLSQIEADLMNPAQRIYLESAWAAIEDAGYGGKRLWGSNTGVYVGYNSAGEALDYLEHYVSPEAAGLIVSGNVNSFLPSRLSYMLNLKGPALVVDTACSSSLVALHQACTALRNKSISMAVVGSVRVFLAPAKEESEIGTSSSSGYTKTFDKAADGTGGGEGVINIVLKPLSDAIADHDHIYCVINGSYINQDGNCIGLTAPNSAAQTEVLVGAWKNAGVSPERISYIEAHGTATKLGDPVEIGGLSEAFLKYTKKKQFCAIGAAKSNFGHLDCAAGMLGILKVLLMMQKKVIPPTIHYHIPNDKIDFIQSPVFVNDTAREWYPENDELIAGVSSFGLSGTNSHVVLQSYQDTRKRVKWTKDYLLTASAKDKDTLIKIVKSYQSYLEGHPEISFSDFCYTVNAGRGQYECRFAGVFSEKEEFLQINEKDILSSAFSSHTKYAKEEEDGADQKLPENDLQKMNHQAKLLCKEKNLKELAGLFLCGAEIDFSLLYQNESVFRVSAPAYPFNRKRCWYRSKKTKKAPERISNTVLHPLIDRCAVESQNLWVFEKQLAIHNCLELREHKIFGVHVLPGTVYVEIANFIWKYIFGNVDYTISDVTFFSLVTCAPEDTRILQAIAEKKEGNLAIRILSRGSNEIDWSIHAEISIRRGCEPSNGRDIDIEKTLSGYNKQYVINKESNESDFVQVGEHWNCGDKLFLGDNSAVLFAKLDDDLSEDVGDYGIFPALLDVSVNAGMSLLEGRYLPLHYKDAVFYSDIRGSVISRVERENKDLSNGEVERFHVEMFDQNGRLIAEVKQYAIKRLDDSSKLFEADESRQIHSIFWRQEQFKDDSERLDNKQAVVVIREDQQNNPLLSALSQSFRKLVCLIIGKKNEERIPDSLLVEDSEEGIEQGIQQLNLSDGTFVISLLSDGDNPCIEHDFLLSELKQTFYLTRALAKNVRQNIKLIILAQNASVITRQDMVCHPYRRSVMAFAACLDLEQLNFELCIIDKDAETSSAAIINEMSSLGQKSVVGFRKNVRYIECIERKPQDMQPISPRNGDVVVIPGGYGGIGLSVCEYFSEHFPETKLILLSRNGVTNDPLDNRNIRLAQLKAKGRQVSVLKADVTNFQAVCSAVASIRREFGRINGVIFAAGLPGGGILQNEAWEDEWNVIRVKSQGVQNIDLATRTDTPEYFVVFSSMTSLFGAGGQTSYAAANGFLDSYAGKRNLECKGTVVINWTGWSESGMAVKSKVNADDSPFQFVDNLTGRELFGKALSFGAERIAVFRFKEKIPIDYALQVRKRVEIPKEYIMEENKDMSESSIEQVAIYGKSPEKLTDYEKRIAQIWARTLKTNEINIYAKFFEIGGNSLLAAYLQKEINRVFPNALDVTDVFAYSTIADMAEYISNKNEVSAPKNETDSSEDGDIENLLQQFVSGELSIEEIESMI